MLATVSMISGCAAPSNEPDFGPFIDVWTSDPPAAPGQPVDYLILQGDFSVCSFTVRGPQDADYAGGEYTLTPDRLTLTLYLKDGSKQVRIYAVNSFQRGELRLTEASPGGSGQPIVLKHTKAYSSCADAQTVFGLRLKLR